MPDITMCQGVDNIEQCSTCYRKTAIPNQWQAYFVIQPILEQEEKENCEYYIKS